MSEKLLWDGITQSAALHEADARRRSALFAAAKSASWEQVAARKLNIDLLQMPEPDSASLNTILHYAALTNADMAVVQRLIQAGALRAYRNASGQRPVDIAREQGHERLVALLEPELRHVFAFDGLCQIEQQFHDLIRREAGSLIEIYGLQLPQLEVLLELENPALFFPIPGFYGSFEACLRTDSRDPALFTFSASRVTGGSEQLHKITADRVEQLAAGDDAVTEFMKISRNH